jgi:manganese efflux pump family protein
MSFLYIIGIALALAMDALAVSIAVGVAHHPVTGRQTLRLASTFGLFQFGMCVAGWAAGESVIKYIGRYDHWVAFLLLLIVGGRMIHESFENDEGEDKKRRDPTALGPLLVLGVATSLDSLAVGLSLAALRASILYPAAVIGIVAFVMSVAGIKLGPALGKVFGRRAELFGGLVLIAIGIKILADHLRGG